MLHIKVVTTYSSAAKVPTVVFGSVGSCRAECKTYRRSDNRTIRIRRQTAKVEVTERTRRKEKEKKEELWNKKLANN
jgi:hypothetical protein